MNNKNSNTKMIPYKIGNKRGLKINDKDLINQIYKSLESYININDRGYKFLDNSNLNYLKINKHLVTLTSFGKKYLIFFTKINNQKYIFYINRKNNDIISVKHRFKDDIFKNTLIEGELLKDKNTDDTNIFNNWRFSILDIIVYKNNLLNKSSLYERINILNDMFENEHIQDKNFDIAEFEIKKYFEYKHMKDVYVRHMLTLPYNCSGFLFKNEICLERSIMYIFQENRTKKKISDVKINKKTSNICSFLIKKTELPDIYELYCSKEGSLYRYGFAGVPSLANSQFLKNLFINVKNDSNIYVKCSFNSMFSKWIPFNKDDTIDDYDNIKLIDQEKT